ncbi:hypothetical protein Zm00014a_036883 [Zea mays]|uniref:Protein tesmin/TSO1-like CXC 2 n=1 Tax=Zea mays TaxID=4577 RepID=A0A317YA89_MAIZE|nr:hypothetical protein Zm00014a_036883 [Zea mays]
MDASDSPPSGRPSSSAVALYGDSPIFDFVDSLSPIAPPKPLGSTQSVQLFKSSNLAPVSSIFTSPQVNPRKESKSTISCIELSGSAALAPETCTPFEDATNSPSKWLQSTLFGSETLGDANKQDIDGKPNHTADVEHVKPSSTCSDQNGFDQMDSSTSGRNVQENELAKQDSNDLAPCSLNHLITHCGTGNSVISISDLALEAQQQSWKVKGDSIISSTSLAVDQENLEDSRREDFVEQFGSYIQSAADGTHVYYADAAAGVTINHDQEMLPAIIRNQLDSNDYILDTSKVSIDGTALSQHQYGTHRCSLFNDKSGTSNKSMQNISDINPASICGNNYLNPVDPALCALPGIGLHLNTVALNLSDMPLTINHPLLSEQTSPATVIPGSETVLYGSEVFTHVDNYSSQKTMPNADKSGQQIHKKKRRKLQKDDGESCRHCVLLLTTEKLEKGGKAKGTHGEEDKLAFGKHHVVSQSGDIPAYENPLVTPLLETYRSPFLLPSTCSKLPPPTAGCSYGLHNPRPPMKSDVLFSPLEDVLHNPAEMVLGNGFSDTQEVGSSCTTSVKVVSPNKKRVASLQIGTALSPIGSSSRKLVLKSFPSLTGDADSEPH